MGGEPGGRAYGWLIIAGLPYWNRLVAAQDGAELQTRFGYGATEAGEALAAIDTQARQDAFIFYALDAPNAVLYGVAIAAMIAFGLRQLRWERSLPRWLVALPLIAGADLIETACLAIALAAGGRREPIPHWARTMGIVASVLR